MNLIYFSLPGNDELTVVLAKKNNAEIGAVEIRSFPDKETILEFYPMLNKNMLHWFAHFINQTINYCLFIFYHKT